MKLIHYKQAGRQEGISLLQCLAYIATLAVINSLGGYTLAKAWDQWRGLDHNAADIQKTLSLGEHWRADIRAATGSISSEPGETNQTVTIPTRAGEVTYEFRDGRLSRRASRNAPFVVLYQTVRRSQMEPIMHDGVRAWRWEIELQSTYKKVRVKPLFTFIAVPGKEVAP